MKGVARAVRLASGMPRKGRVLQVLTALGEGFSRNTWVDFAEEDRRKVLDAVHGLRAGGWRIEDVWSPDLSRGVRFLRVELVGAGYTSEVVSLVPHEDRRKLYRIDPTWFRWLRDVAKDARDRFEPIEVGLLQRVRVLR